MRENHAKKKGQKPSLPIAQARDNKFQLDFSNGAITKPNTLSNKTFVSYSLAELRDFIDWTPFFQTWELAGRFPRILEDEVVGEEATRLYKDANDMLDKIVAEDWLEARAVIGMWPANSVGDDIELYTDDSRSEVLSVVHSLRQQNKKAAGQPNFALADFVAPKDSGVADYMGGFVVTAGLNIEAHIERYEADHDDYNSILLKALADRLAEAVAERMHQRVREEFWGYGAGEALSNDQLIKEEYRGILL